MPYRTACTALHFLVGLNGIYDLLCSASLLFLGERPLFCHLARLHTHMFEGQADQQNPLVQRLLAYWIATYGFVRLVAGITHSDLADQMAAVTYIIEGGAYALESAVHRSTVESKSMWVSWSCAAMSACICAAVWICFE